MTDLAAAIEARWLVFAAVGLLALVMVWWLIARARKGTRRREYQPDVLDEGIAPAARNQALIDAAPAAQVVMPPLSGDALGGLAELAAVRAADEIDTARMAEPAEPQPAVAPPPPPPPSPAQTPEPEVIAQPVEMPGLDEAVTPQQTAIEVQTPDAVSVLQPEPQSEPQSEPLPEPAPKPIPMPEPLPAPPQAPASSSGDDLSKIKGLGPKLQMLLPTLGLSTYAQIAALSEADLAMLDPKLGPFAGRPARDGWVEQAQYLAAGDVAGFEARFGKV